MSDSYKQWSSLFRDTVLLTEQINHMEKTLKLPTWSADKRPQGLAANAGVSSESRREN